MQQSSRVIIPYALILVFLAKEKKKSNETNARKKKKEKTNTTKDFKILMYVTMRVVRLCNIKNRHQ